MSDIPDLYFNVVFTDTGARRFASWVARRAPRANMVTQMDKALRLAGFQWHHEPVIYEVSGLYTVSHQPETFVFAIDDLDVDSHTELMWQSRITPAPAMERIYRCSFTDTLTGEHRTSVLRYRLDDIAHFKNASPVIDDWVLAPTDDHLNPTDFERPDQGDTP